MTLELLIGPYRSGKTGRLLQELVASKKQYPLDHCLILVPSHRYGRLLTKQLAEHLRDDGEEPIKHSFAPDDTEHKIVGLFGVQIATIYEACEQILQASGQFSTALPQKICVTLVKQALNDLDQRGELSHLKAIADFPGTSNSIMRLIDEMERAALTPSQVIATVNNTAASSSRHIELSKVYKDYWQRLDALESSDQKRLAFSCRELLANKKVPGLHLRWLIIDGFDRISPLQAEIMHGLSQHANNTRIAFDYLLPEQRGVDAPDYEDCLDDYSWKDSSFAELTNRFSLPPTFVDPPAAPAQATTESFQCLDRFIEIEEVARRCKQAIIHRQVGPGQILVVTRDLHQYALAAKAAFEAAGLPYFIDESIEYATLPSMKIFCQALKLSIDQFPRAAVLECLRSKYLNIVRLGLTGAQIETLDKKSLEHGIVSGLEPWTNFSKRALPAEVASSLGKMFTRLTPIPQHTLSGYCRWLEDLVEELYAVGANNTGSIDIKPNKDQVEMLQGVRAAVRTLMLQEELLGQQQLSYDQFVTEFQAVVEQSTFRRQQPLQTAILICSAEQAPNRRFDEVFIVGVTEGQFPKHSGESGFVSADERARWCSFGIDIRNPREHAGFERALFRSLMERARRRICFSCPQLDLSGDELVPSFYLTDETARITALPTIDSARTHLTAPTSARNAISGWLWLKPGIQLSEKLETSQLINDYWEAIGVPLLGAYSRHEKNSQTPYNGYLNDLVQSNWLTVKLPASWSATAFNRYGECPFKFWMAQMLKIDPRKEPESDLSIQAKGKLYHKALELYYTRVYLDDTATNPEIDKQAVLALALSDAITSFKDDPQFRPGIYWQNEQKDMLFRLLRFVAYDEQRMEKDKLSGRPSLLESRFGFNFGQSAPPLVIDTDYGAAIIRGVIDRIDLSQDAEGKQYAAVIDYKTGSTAISIDDARRGANIQLPIYALALQKSILPGTKVVAGHYLGISSAKSNGSMDFESEKLADLLDSTIDHVRQTVSGVAHGDFSVRPYSSKACKRCDHKSACRITDLKSADEDDN